jgi:hypothetical protein
MIARREKVRFATVFVSFALALSVSFVGAQSAAAAGGKVLPPNARPHGYSLADMARIVGPFTTGGNQLPEPETPIQVLYGYVNDVEDNVLIIGSNSFPDVRPGTMFYVPIQSSTNGEPVVGDFPSDESGATHYFFDQSQLGARDYEIVVDGKVTPVGPGYLVGPVATPLPDGGDQIITLGVFLDPLTPGEHTVIIRGGLFGQALAAFGLTCLCEQFTYHVEVTPTR